MGVEYENPIVFLDVAHEGEKMGRVVIELFKNRVPKAAENFRALCTGEKGLGKSGMPLHYRGSVFHRLLPGVMVLAGDIVNRDGSGGESIYGTYFEDEDLKTPHDHPGLLSTVNAGRPDTNSSQFVITTGLCPQLNGKNVVFGRVVKGLAVIEDLARVPTNDRGKPLEKVSILECGELSADRDSWGIEDHDDLDVYCPYPNDWDLLNSQTSDESLLDYEQLLDIVERIKAVGNAYFLKGQVRSAEKKYNKALRYHEFLSKLPDTPRDDPNGKRIKVAIVLNLATVKLRQCKNREALNFCNQALAMDGKNSKALFRKGQVHMAMNEYESGLSYLEKALKESPNNQDIIAEIEKLKKKMKSYLSLEKQIYKKMLKLS